MLTLADGWDRQVAVFEGTYRGLVEVLPCQRLQDLGVTHPWLTHLLRHFFPRVLSRQHLLGLAFVDDVVDCFGV